MKRIFRSLAALLIIAISFSAISFAWLAGGKYLNFPSSFGGSAVSAYFAGGDGSEKNPFIIKNSVHLYNLAWLQYLGYFNQRADFNNGRDQTYFTLGSNVDMKGRAIPPIGTEQYPFIGNFDGNGHTVKKLTVSNKRGTGDLVYAPTNANFSSTNDMLCHVNGDNSEVEIVGMFGVTGNYNGYFKKYEDNGHKVDGTVASVSNFYVDKIHVRSNSAKTLAGLAAGYIGGNFSNVGVYRGDLNFAANAQANGVAGSGILSKYSLVGAYNEDLITWDDNTGGTTGWGGSIDMKSLFTRLSNFRTNASYVDNSFNDITATNGQRRFYEKGKGSVYFSSYNSSGKIIHLYGGKVDGGYAMPEQSYNENGADGYFISSNGNYFTLNNINSMGNSTDIKNAVTWFYNPTEKSLYAYANCDEKTGGNGTKLYVNITNYSVIGLSETQITEWEKVGNVLSGKYLYYTGKIYTRYLTFSNKWTVGDSATNLTFTTCEKGLQYYSPTYVYSGKVNNNSETRNFATYIPLLTDDDGNVVEKNTGYIASGPTTVDPSNSKYARGDIRVWETDLNSALNKSSYGTGDSLTIYTQTAKSEGFKSFTDAYGSATNGKALNLVKYENAKKNFDDMFEGSSSTVYGMHFMNAPISIKNVYTADYALINGDEYKDGNYQMVANAIDFKVKKNGYINFFSGTYYSGNKNFFSLHEIIRKADDPCTISEVREISKIYSSGDDYVYVYADGSTSTGVDKSTLTDDNLKFNCGWINNTGNDMVDNAVYYFEIPVNAGEYALGSASTGDGAYLMYLDIGANGTGDGDGPDETPYTMDKVRFVNSKILNDDNSVTLTAYDPALITLSGSSTAAETAVFQRDEDETDGKLKLAYRIIYNNTITAKEVTTGMTREDSGLKKSSDETDD